MDVLTGNGAPRPAGQAAQAASGRPDAALALRDHRWLFALLVVALIARVATLGAYPLMDNTEARYAEIARKIVETGDWVMPQFKYGVPFWSKPPLSMWMTAVTYLALGVNEFSARLPSLLACLPVAWMTYGLAARRDGADAALRATVVLVTTPLYFVSAGAVMTDPALVLGTTLSMAAFWYAMTGTGRTARWWGYAFFLGLAIGLLAKGPVGVVLTLMPVGLWTLWKGGIGTVWKRLPWISGLALTVVVSVPWYLLAEQRTPGFLEYFLVGEHWKRFTESGWKGDMFGTAHSRPRGSIWLFGLVSTLPWSALWVAFAVQARRSRARTPKLGANDGWHAYLWLWMLAPAVFFTFAGNILFTYVLPGLPAFALLVGEAWTAATDKVRRGAGLRVAALAIPVGIVLAVLFVLPDIGLEHSHKALVAGYLAKREGDAQRLIYLNEAPQSAEFYARGKVTTVAKAGDLDRYLDDAPRDFFALTQSQLDPLPALRARLTPVGSFGHYTLFVEAPPRAAAAQ